MINKRVNCVRFGKFLGTFPYTGSSYHQSSKQDESITQDPSTHKAYVPCSHLERSKDHMLFILNSREVIILPEKATNTLFFTDCNESNSI